MPMDHDATLPVARSTEEFPAADGTPLSLHRWLPTDRAPEAALFYIHGLQSHAGWLFETGAELAGRGIAVYAPDRRGSGASGGLRGHLPSAASVLDDYAALFDVVRDRTPGLPLTVVGQSFGGSLLAALLSTTRIAPDAAVFCAPALGQQHARLGRDGMAELLKLEGTCRTPVALSDTDYTDDPRYLAAMANDHLMLRQVSDRFRSVMAELELAYTAAGPWCPFAVRGPVYFATPERDAIIDLDVARGELARLQPEAVEVHFAADTHYLEFSAVRRQLWDWLADTAVLHTVCRERTQA